MEKGMKKQPAHSKNDTHKKPATKTKKQNDVKTAKK